MAKITNIFTRLFAAIKFVYEHTTIEPVVFFLNFSLNIDTITYDQLKITKSCLTDFNYSEEVCDNLVDGNYTTQNDLVQDEVRHNKYILWIIK